jgi:hypothetical protein
MPNPDGAADAVAPPAVSRIARAYAERSRLAMKKQGLRFLFCCWAA